MKVMARTVMKAVPGKMAELVELEKSTWLSRIVY